MQNQFVFSEENIFQIFWNKAEKTTQTVKETFLQKGRFL